MELCLKVFNPPLYFLSDVSLASSVKGLYIICQTKTVTDYFLRPHDDDASLSNKIYTNACTYVQIYTYADKRKGSSNY